MIDSLRLTLPKKVKLSSNTATGETDNTEPTNSTESDNCGFPTATLQPESVDVDSLVNSVNVKQPAVFSVVAR